MTAHPGSPKSATLRNLYWRSEILRVMYWLRGERLSDLVDVPLLRHYLGITSAEARRHLVRLVEDGLVVRDGSWYSLSDEGLAEREEFATAFSDLLKPRVGPCSDECWCEVSNEEAAACAASRHERKRGSTA